MLKPTWERDGIALYCGDCLQILPQLEAGSVDAVVTDPPYGVALKRKRNDFRESPNFDGGKSVEASVKYADNPALIRGQIRFWCDAMFGVCQRSLIFPGLAMMYDYPRPASIGCAYNSVGAGMSSWGFVCMHPILYYGKDPYLAKGLGSRPSSFRDEQPGREKVDHPCPKPVPWMEWCVRRMTVDAGEVVLDPFMGSGTTGVACVRTGRRFIGIEIEPKYFEIAVSRIEKALSEKAAELPLGATA